jgi:hypothetical protein
LFERGVILAPVADAERGLLFHGRKSLPHHLIRNSSLRFVQQSQAHAFGCWLHEKHQLDEISELMLERYLDDLSSQEEPPTPMRRQKITVAIHLLLKHSRPASVIAPPSAESFPVTEVQQWLTRYEGHLEKVLGLAPGSR